MCEKNIEQPFILIKSILEDLTLCYTLKASETRNNVQVQPKDRFSTKRISLNILTRMISENALETKLLKVMPLRLTYLLPEAEEVKDIKDKKALQRVLNNMDALQQSSQESLEADQKFNQTLQQLNQDYNDHPLQVDTKLQENNTSLLSFEQQTLLLNLAKYSTDLQNYIGMLEDQNISEIFASQNKIIQDCIISIKTHQNLTPELSVQCTQSIGDGFECLWQQVLSDATEYKDNPSQPLVKSQDFTNEGDAMLPQWILNTAKFLEEQKTLLLQIQQQKITKQSAQLQQMQQALKQTEQDKAALEMQVRRLQETPSSSVATTPRSSIGSTDQRTENPFFSNNSSPITASRLPRATQYQK